MNDIQIFTFGQLDTFKAVLQALAVLFDPSASGFFVSDSGLGVGSGAALAAMLASLGLVTTYLGQGKVNGSGPIVALVLYSVLCLPKIQNVWLTDIYTGRTVLVQNIPVGIATIGYAMSTISKGLIESFEQEYSAPGAVGGSQDYISSMSDGNGFLSPLKMMFKLRESAMKFAPSHLTFNIVAYQKHCLNAKVTTPLFDGNELRKSTDPLDYYLTPGLVNPSAMTDISYLGDMQVGSCGELNTFLSADAPGGIEYFLSDPNTVGVYAYGVLMNANDAETEECAAAAGTCSGKADAITKVASLVNQIIPANGTNNMYMEMRLMQDIQSGIGKAANLDDTSISTIAQTMNETVEGARIQEAIEGETFLHFMIPAMNALMYLFYALFPLAMIVMVSKGGQAFVYFGGYMLFGVWIYSWMPVAVVINYSSITSIMEVFHIMAGATPLTMESEQFYVELAMDALAVSSNLMAATPIITLAIVSGSIFALTQVASSAASPSAPSKAGAGATPSYHNNPSIMSLNSEYDSAGAGRSAVGGSTTAKNLNDALNFNTSDMASASLSSAQALQTSSGVNAVKAISKGFTSANGVANSNGSTNGTSTNATVNREMASAYKQAFANAGITTDQWSEDKLNSIGGAIGGGGAKGVGALASLRSDSSERSTKSNTTAEQFASDTATSLSNSKGFRAMETALTSESRTNDTSKERQDAVSALKQYSQSATFADTKQKEASVASQSGTSASYSMSNLVEMMGKQTGAGANSYQGVVDYMSGGVGQAAQELGLGDNSQGFIEKFEEKARQNNKNHLGDENSGMAGASSGYNALKGLQMDAVNNSNNPKYSPEKQAQFAKEAVMWGDAQDNFVQKATGGYLPKSPNITPSSSNQGHFANMQQLDSNAVAQRSQPIAQTSNVAKEASVESLKADNSIATKTANMNAPDPFSKSELSEFKQIGGDFDRAGLTESPTAFYDGFFSEGALDEAANELAPGKQFGGKNGLDDSQKRSVLASQLSSASQKAAQLTSDSIKNTSLESTAGGDFVAGAAGSLSDISKGHENATRSNYSDHHSPGTIAKGELGGLMNVASNVAESFGHLESFKDDMIETSQNAETRNTDMSAKQEEVKAGGAGGGTKGKFGADPDKLSSAIDLAREADSTARNNPSQTAQARQDGADAINALFDQGPKDFFDQVTPMDILSSPIDQGKAQQVYEAAMSIAGQNWFSEGNNAFRDTFNEQIAQGHGVESSLATALQVGGFSQNGVLQNSALATIGASSAGAYTGHKSDVKGNNERAKNYQSDLQDHKSNPEGPKPEKPSSSNKFMKIFGGVGALGMIGAETYNYNDTKSTNAQMSNNTSSDMMQNSIAKEISSLPDNARNSTQRAFMDNLADKMYGENTPQRAQYDVEMSTSKNSLDTDMNLMMDTASYRGPEGNKQPLVSDSDIRNSYNTVKPNSSPKL